MMGRIVGGITDAVGLTDIRGTRQRGEQAAAQQREAALRGAQISAFRPVGMTSRFGTSRFDITDVGGVPRVTGAGYTLSPELLDIQNQLFGLTPGAISAAQQAQAAAQPLGEAAQRLFGLGAGYLAESPEAARQRAFNMLQDVRRPEQMREENRLAATAFGRGRAGVNIGGAGQPELFALTRAREEQRARDVLAAEQAAQQQIQFGSGLFGTGAQTLGQQYAIPSQALGPLQSILGTIGSVEEMGQQPFRLGLAVGGAAQPGATAGAQLLSSGMSQAAATQRAAGDAASAQLTGFMNQMLGAAIGGATGGMGGGGFGGMQARFAQGGLGRSGFGTGFAYGNQDYGMFL
jgi:hypothetical protein